MRSIADRSYRNKESGRSNPPPELLPARHAEKFRKPRHQSRGSSAPACSGPDILPEPKTQETLSADHAGLRHRVLIAVYTAARHPTKNANKDESPMRVLRPDHARSGNTPPPALTRGKNRSGWSHPLPVAAGQESLPITVQCSRPEFGARPEPKWHTRYLLSTPLRAGVPGKPH